MTPDGQPYSISIQRLLGSGPPESMPTLGHDLDLLAGCDLLQLDEFAEQAADRHGIADRQLRAASLGDLKPDLVAAHLDVSR